VVRLVYVGIALTVLLGLVAFVSRGHTSPAGNGAHDRGASQFLANVVFTLWVLAMAGGALVLVYLWSVKRRDTSRQEFRIKPLLMSLLFFAGVLLIMVFAFKRIGGGNGLADLARNVHAGQTARQQLEQAERKRPGRASSPDFNWPLAGGLVALLVGLSVTAVFRAHRRRSDFFKEAAVAHELAQLVDETIDDLRAEADPRKAVIAAYARMERILAVHGLPRRPSEAPLEYLSRVLLELNVTAPAVRRLTDLFERAKFSHHEIDADMKDDAIEALVAFRDEMRVIGATPDPPELPLQDVVAKRP